jgi:hypothetical protein
MAVNLREWRSTFEHKSDLALFTVSAHARVAH